MQCYGKRTSRDAVLKNRRPAPYVPASRRLDEFRVEMLQPRHHFLLQQLQRIVPGLRLVLVVEAEHQQRAETTDLAVDGFDLLGDRRRRADDPVVTGAVIDRDVAVRHVGRMLEIVLEAEVTE